MLDFNDRSEEDIAVLLTEHGGAVNDVDECKGSIRNFWICQDGTIVAQNKMGGYGVAKPSNPNSRETLLAIRRYHELKSAALDTAIKNVVDMQKMCPEADLQGKLGGLQAVQQPHKEAMQALDVKLSALRAEAAGRREKHIAALLERRREQAMVPHKEGTRIKAAK